MLASTMGGKGALAITSPKVACDWSKDPAIS